MQYPNYDLMSVMQNQDPEQFSSGYLRPSGTAQAASALAASPTSGTDYSWLQTPAQAATVSGIPPLQAAGLGLQGIGMAAQVYGSYKQRKAQERQQAKLQRLAEEERRINKALLQQTVRDQQMNSSMSTGGYAQGLFDRMRNVSATQPVGY